MSGKKTSRSRREKQLQKRYLKRIYRVFRSHSGHKKPTRRDGYGADEGHGWTVRMDRLLGNRKLCRRLDVHHQVVGTVDFENQVIWVDYTSDLIATFIHECLHVVLERKYEEINMDEDSGYERTVEEAEVSKLERLIMRHLTARQAKNLMLLLLRHHAHGKK